MEDCFIELFIHYSKLFLVIILSEIKFQKKQEPCISYNSLFP